MPAAHGVAHLARGDRVADAQVLADDLGHHRHLDRQPPRDGQQERDHPLADLAVARQQRLGPVVPVEERRVGPDRAQHLRRARVGREAGQLGDGVRPVRLGAPPDPPVQQPPPELRRRLPAPGADRGQGAPVRLRIRLREPLERGPVARGVLGGLQVAGLDAALPGRKARPQGVVQQRYRNQEHRLVAGQRHVVRQQLDQPRHLPRHAGGEVTVLPRIVAQRLGGLSVLRGELAGQRDGPVTVRRRVRNATPHRMLRHDRFPALWHHAGKLTGRPQRAAPIPRVIRMWTNGR
ncbi:hypothetical protein ACFQZ5_44475 [Dactylosporangium darangshiense]|uniref:hypothetical protein n=1 Tax=Dactylosporangium darangshiense TaxID=579108 RepID=UPI00363CF35B